jgi:hypothetical protein
MGGRDVLRRICGQFHGKAKSIWGCHSSGEVLYSMSLFVIIYQRHQYIEQDLNFALPAYPQHIYIFGRPPRLSGEFSGYGEVESKSDWDSVEANSLPGYWYN